MDGSSGTIRVAPLAALLFCASYAGAAAAQSSPSSGEPIIVGQAPENNNQPPAVAPLFEQPGILTPRHELVVEPSAQYSYSSSNRVALVGYTVIPAITIGLINVQEVKSNTVTLTASLRYGLTSRWEVEVRAPYVYRNDDVVALPLNTGSSTAAPLVNQAIGSDLGDAEVTTRYQFNDGGADRPYYIGSLRFKSRTGTDPFEVETEAATGFNDLALQQQLPTGSGFYGLQPGISVIMPADPVVLFGGGSYLYNFARNNVSENLDNARVYLGKVAAGDIITINFGVGLALSGRTSISLGYEQDSVGATRINGATVPGSSRVELGTLLLALSYRRSASSSFVVAVGVGATRDTPDITLTLRVPEAF